MVVYLLTTGDGSDGNEWQVQGIYDSEEAATVAKNHYERERKRPDGTAFRDFANKIEMWKVEDIHDAQAAAQNQNP